MVNAAPNALNMGAARDASSVNKPDVRLEGTT